MKFEAKMINVKKSNDKFMKPIKELKECPCRCHWNFKDWFRFQKGSKAFCSHCKKSEKPEEKYKCCGGDIKVRNPKGYCDHLYYPENCDGNCKCPDCYVLNDKFGNVPIQPLAPQSEEEIKLIKDHNKQSEIREKISKILVKWGMPTRQAAISEIMALFSQSSLKQRIVEKMNKMRPEITLKNDLNDTDFNNFNNGLVTGLLNGYNQALEDLKEEIGKI